MNVFWSIDHRKAIGSLRVQTPELVLKNKPVSAVGYNVCPAFRDYFHNVYGWKSVYTYSLEKRVDVRGIEVYASDMHNQEFFDNNVHIRSIEEQILSIIQMTSFITDSPSLKMSIEHPYFEDNKFTSSCYVIPGVMDIGKYYRRLDFAFHIKEGHSKCAFDEGDIIYYLRFHTPEKIHFKQYFMTDKLREYHDMVEELKVYSISTPRPLSFFYDIAKKYKLKSRILKEIKENLVNG